MLQNTPIDNYTLTLEGTADRSGGQDFRSIATNIKDRRIVESQLDSVTVRSLLIRVLLDLSNAISKHCRGHTILGRSRRVDTGGRRSIT